jgi:prephenate dehydrogenase
MSRRLHHLRGKTIAIIGLGQIGGSIVKRLSPLRPQIELVAHDRDRRLSRHVSRHAKWVTSLSSVVECADVIVLAIPVPAIIETVRKISRLTRQQSGRLMILDTGTVKQAVKREALRHKWKFDYVGLHPLAGGEQEGWESAEAELFVGRVIAHTVASPIAVRVAREFIALLGGNPLVLDARMHDRYVAEAIGLPHILAFAARGMGADNPLRAGSWNSLTRVAAANPEMVAGFLSANVGEQRRAVSRFKKELARLERALGNKTPGLLERLLDDRRKRDR